MLVSLDHSQAQALDVISAVIGLRFYRTAE